MQVEMRQDGTLRGDSTERGKFVRGTAVSGTISSGRWWPEGYVEVRARTWQACMLHAAACDCDHMFWVLVMFLRADFCEPR
jgi:hypothetical protein